MPQKSDTDELRQIIARNILRERTVRGWSQAELARRSNRNQARISELEAGQVNHRIDTIEAVASAFGVPVASIMMPDRQTNSRK